MKWFLIAAFVLLSGFTCSKNIPELEPKSYVGGKVVNLFEHEGCKVYKFYDDNNERAYFTNCSGSTKWTQTRQSGKTRITDHYSTEGGKR